MCHTAIRSNWVTYPWRWYRHLMSMYGHSISWFCPAQLRGLGRNSRTSCFLHAQTKLYAMLPVLAMQCGVWVHVWLRTRVEHSPHAKEEWVCVWIEYLNLEVTARRASRWRTCSHSMSDTSSSNNLWRLSASHSCQAKRSTKVLTSYSKTCKSALPTNKPGFTSFRSNARRIITNVDDHLTFMSSSNCSGGERDWIFLNSSFHCADECACK